MTNKKQQHVFTNTLVKNIKHPSGSLYQQAEAQK
jgi:hypothetical protein